MHDEDHGEHRMRLGGDIADRLLRLAVNALKLAAELPRNPAARHVGDELVRAATSAGANYEEARGGESRRDFIHKVSIAAKEVREARYWFAVVARSGWEVPEVGSCVQEAAELSAILTASARTARANAPDDE
jgi:four helix bundle protein